MEKKEVTIIDRITVAGVTLIPISKVAIVINFGLGGGHPAADA